jgi:hypothetical protein
MTIKGRAVLSTIGALGLILAGAGPALAQHSGGGHSGGGGGHSGGGHASFGGHAGGGHAAVGHMGGGAHFAGPTHFAGPAHFAATTRYPTAYHGGFSGHGTAYGGHGYSTAWHGGTWAGWHGGYWGGGYWHGGWWPRCWYGPGFAWFLPVLPLAYATYWWGGIPYYYANDVYYTWNPGYGGYVATDPPPVADSSGGGEGAAAAPGDAGAPNPGPGPGGPTAGQIFMYPKNGQSAEQQAVDRAECQKWAASQAGQVAQNGSDYNRAMVACVEGRGYSAR